LQFSDAEEHVCHESPVFGATQVVKNNRRTLNDILFYRRKQILQTLGDIAYVNV